MPPYWIKDSSNNLAIIPRPRGWDWLPDDLANLKREGIGAVVSALTTEENQELGLVEEAKLCSQSDLLHLSFAIEDRSVPSSAREFQDFLVRVDHALDNGRKVGVHCRAGIGRSSIVVASLLIRHGHSLDRAFSLIQEARGCPVPDTAEQKEWVERFARDAAGLR
jgi:protein-tyrosine phosphatase